MKLFVLLLTISPTLWAQTQVTEEAYTPDRAAANLHETILNPSNVNSASFGKLFSQTVDTSIFAQPLYVPNVPVPGKGNHNVVYVETMANSVYAFDADTNQPALWSINLGPGVGPHYQGDLPLYGIMSTPYIDVSSFRMYLVTSTTESGADVYRLHVLDIRSGTELLPSVVISGSSSGATFEPSVVMQRPGLALVNGEIIIAFGSLGDMFTYNGWIFAYNTSLNQSAVLCLTPTGSEGGIWMSGRAPVVDSRNNIYFETANGTYDGVSNFGESFIKLNTSLAILDWFAPDDFASLNSVDEDLGSSGPLLIPGTSTLIGAGKEGIVYLVSTNNMGKEWAGNSQILQSFSNGGTGFFNGGVWNGGAFYNSTANPTYYLWANSLPLSAYPFNGTTLNVNGVTHSSLSGFSESYGASLAVSANGPTPGTGILWATMPNAAEERFSNENPGILMAFNAANLNELWNSSLNSGNSPGLWSKFRSPVVANGKVYLGSNAGVNGPQATLSVYGLTCASVPEVTNVFINLNVAGQPTTPGPAILLLSAN